MIFGTSCFLFLRKIVWQAFWNYQCTSLLTSRSIVSALFEELSSIEFTNSVYLGWSFHRPVSTREWGLPFISSYLDGRAVKSTSMVKRAMGKRWAAYTHIDYVGSNRFVGLSKFLTKYKLQADLNFDALHLAPCYVWEIAVSHFGHFRFTRSPLKDLGKGSGEWKLVKTLWLNCCSSHRKKAGYTLALVLMHNWGPPHTELKIKGGLKWARIYHLILPPQLPPLKPKGPM